MQLFVYVVLGLGRSLVEPALRHECSWLRPMPRTLYRGRLRSQTLQGLALFKGGVLMVSHDQHLIESTVDELWAVENGRGEGLLPLCCRTHA